MKCPICKSILYQDEWKEYETLLEHVSDPNIEKYPLRPTYKCPNPVCIAFGIGYWGIMGGHYGGNCFFPLLEGWAPEPINHIPDALI